MVIGTLDLKGGKTPQEIDFVSPFLFLTNRCRPTLHIAFYINRF
jgi:hypothetical protein